MTEVARFAPPAPTEAARAAPDADAARASRLRAAATLSHALEANLTSVVKGAPAALRVAVVAALSGGHLLIEDVPGVGKTVLARTLAVSLGAELSRIQGHPDLLPSDVTGVTVYDQRTGAWDFRPGPVFGHVVLLDELNRTPPRTQSALLESMDEQQVTVDGRTWPLPQPHLVLATQNPVGQLGTFPLVESQRDRFALCATVGYPDAATEAGLVLHDGGRDALAALRAVCSVGEWAAAIGAVGEVVVAQPIAAYAVAIARGTREGAGVRLGASPRASISLVRSAQAHALVSGRGYVAPDDVAAMAVPSLAHRLLADGDSRFAAAAVSGVLSSLPAPRP
ncbi:MAG: AAA family ATPase [Acidimicrobiales bacterium]